MLRQTIALLGIRRHPNAHAVPQQADHPVAATGFSKIWCRPASYPFLPKPRRQNGYRCQAWTHRKPRRHGKIELLRINLLRARGYSQSFDPRRGEAQPVASPRRDVLKFLWLEVRHDKLSDRVHAASCFKKLGNFLGEDFRCVVWDPMGRVLHSHQARVWNLTR